MIPNPHPTRQPKDLGLKIGSHEEVVWARVRDEAKQLIEQSKDNLIIQNAMLTLAEEQIEIEKKKMLDVNTKFK